MSPAILAALESLAVQLGEAWWKSRTQEQKDQMEEEVKTLLTTYLLQHPSFDPNPTDPHETQDGAWPQKVPT